MPSEVETSPLNDDQFKVANSDSFTHTRKLLSGTVEAIIFGSFSSNVRPFIKDLLGPSKKDPLVTTC